MASFDSGPPISQKISHTSGGPRRNDIQLRTPTSRPLSSTQKASTTPANNTSASAVDAANHAATKLHQQRRARTARTGPNRTTIGHCCNRQLNIDRRRTTDQVAEGASASTHCTHPLTHRKRRPSRTEPRTPRRTGNTDSRWGSKETAPP